MVSKRGKIRADLKVDVVMALVTGAKTSAEICRERNIADKLLYRWKNELLERLPSVFAGERTVGEGTSERIGELERMVGRLALENEIPKNATSWREGQRGRNGICYPRPYRPAARNHPCQHVRCRTADRERPG